jgi:hypothetical protein
LFRQAKLPLRSIYIVPADITKVLGSLLSSRYPGKLAVQEPKAVLNNDNEGFVA